MGLSRILIVDDNEAFVAYLQGSLEKLGYPVCGIACCGEEAIEKAGQIHPELILMDISLAGGIDGIETTKQIKARFNIPVIYLTASSDKETIERAMISEAFGYLVKPFDIKSLHTNIEMALYKHFMEGKAKQTELENRKLKQKIEFILGAAKTGLNIIDAQYNLHFVDQEQQKIYGDPTGKKCYEYFMDKDEPCAVCGALKAMQTQASTLSEEILLKEGNRPTQVTTIPYKDDDGTLYFAQVKVDITERKQTEENLKNTLAKLRQSLGGIIKAMALTVESRDPYTAGHQRRVADLARAIADEMHLSKDQVEGIRIAGVIHDLGKISIPAEILSKPGRISDIEFSLIKTHSQVGFDILQSIEFPWPVAQIVYQHHERMDGSGYPRGLAGENILMEARVLMVADVVEAMSSHRPYRTALGVDKALEEISKNSGLVYDAKVVEACLRLFTEKKFAFK